MTKVGNPKARAIHNFVGLSLPRITFGVIEPVKHKAFESAQANAIAIRMSVPVSPSQPSRL